MVSSYCSAVTPGAAVKRARRLVVRASMTGAADGLVVAIDGLLRVDAPDRADLQPSTSYRVGWRARILSQKALRNLSAFSTARAFSSQQSRAPHDGCSRVHRRDQPEARLRDPRPRPALLTDTANKRWSLYGAPWVQPVAISGKSLGRTNGRNKPKPLPWVAIDCHEEYMVRRGSTVRVRQRALQSPCKSGDLCSGRLADSAA